MKYLSKYVSKYLSKYQQILVVKSLVLVILEYSYGAVSNLAEALLKTMRYRIQIIETLKVANLQQNSTAVSQPSISESRSLAPRMTRRYSKQMIYQLLARI